MYADHCEPSEVLREALARQVATRMIDIISRVRCLLKSWLLGPVGFRQHYNIGLRDPQAEVSVWLHGPDGPQDVTHQHVIACAHPLTIGIGLDRIAVTEQKRLSLQFRERNGKHEVLGEIGLRLRDRIAVGSGQLYLFEVRDSRNYCLRSVQRWRYGLRCEYVRWSSGRRGNSSQIRPTRLETRSISTFYICPRPIVLVSVMNGKVCNIFPMDLIGPIGVEAFCLALHNTSTALPLLERSRTIALSSIPIEQRSLVYALGKNHSSPPFSKDQIPFDTVTSSRFGLPVPRFSSRVREMQVVTIRPLGSHKLFVCNTLEDRAYASGLQLFVIHGIYQFWRQRAFRDRVEPSNRE